MRFNSLYLCTLAIVQPLVVGLPLDNNAEAQQIAARKTYAIVNVDGGGSTDAPVPPPATTVVDGSTKTKTVQVTAPAETKTASAVPTTTSPPSTFSSSSSNATVTASPSVVTITVTESSASTSYYDDGMWHTSYAVRTWAAVTTMRKGKAMMTPAPMFG